MVCLMRPMRDLNTPMVLKKVMLTHRNGTRHIHTDDSEVVWSTPDGMASMRSIQVNHSRKGIGLIGPTPISAGTIVHLRSSQQDTVGTVRYCQPDGEAYRIGISLVANNALWQPQLDRTSQTQKAVRAEPREGIIGRAEMRWLDSGTAHADQVLILDRSSRGAGILAQAALPLETRISLSDKQWIISGSVPSQGLYRMGVLYDHTDYWWINLKTAPMTGR